MHRSIPWMALAGIAMAITHPVHAQPAPAERPIPWRSPLDTYQAFQDAPPQDWKQSNDTVGRIGGWKAYAREAQADAPAPANAPIKPAPQPTATHLHSHPGTKERP